MIKRSFILAVLGVVFSAGIVMAQLAEMEITPFDSDRTIVFQNHPDNAAIYIESSIENLSIDSNLGIIADESEPDQGIYRIIVAPSRQQIYFDAPGYIRASLPTGNLSPRQVLFVRVEPKDRSITETGTMLIRTNPAGATIRIDGIPGEFEGPHTFTDILAQTYRVRVSMEDHFTEEVQVRVDPLRPVIEEVTLTPSIGFLTLNVPDVQLHLTSEEFEDEFRVSYTEGQPLQLDVGEYRYRLSRRHYQDARGSFEIRPGERTTVSTNLNPDYATLQVNANVEGFRLSSPDNDAPASGQADIIYLERGMRQVLVEADNYAPLSLQIRASAGAQMDTSVTMITLAEMEDRQRREQLSRGILNVSADLDDAEIYIDGELRGRGDVTLSMIPGTYSLQIRHPAGSHSGSVNVPSADVADYGVILRPSRSRAIGLSTVIPGAGHIYTRRSRGYLYLAGVLGAAGFAYSAHTTYQSQDSAYNEALQAYKNANSVNQAIQLRQEVLEAYDSQVSASERLTYALVAIGAVYAIQLIDIAVTQPSYGYREQHASRLQAGVGSGGLTLRFQF